MLRRNHMLLFGLIFLFVACKEVHRHPLIIPDIFSDQMILQRETDVKFWGSYTPGEQIKLVAGWGVETSVIADEYGKWEADLPTPEAGGPYQVQIETADITIEIEDVMIGEVWLASGQSNMEMPLKGWPPKDVIDNSAAEIAAADFPAIRMFTVENNFSQVELDDISGSWVSATPETAGEFSATAFFFARKLYLELNIPIGIIHSSWGGTPAEAWTSADGLRKIGDFDDVLKTLSDTTSQEKIESWFNAFSKTDVPGNSEAWKVFTLDDEDKAAESYDDSEWDKTELPGRFDFIDGDQFNGVVWLRKEFEIKSLEDNEDYFINIGAVDDMDAVYVNGQKTGSMMGPGFYNAPREYKIENSVLRIGKNTVAIRAIDTGGPGWVNGPVIISSTDGKQLDLSGEWKIKIFAEIYNGQFVVYEDGTDFSERPDVSYINQNTPSALYNAMIHPLIPYTIKGAIWYQGESNVGRAAQYTRLFPGMIEDWRDKWGYQFPFYYVQIAPFIYNPDPALQISQELRDAQRLAMRTPKTGMVVTLDVGNPENIHPANKKDVGERLARWALFRDYGLEIVPSGPLYKSVKAAGNKLIVEFDFIGGGLVSAGNVLSGFEIAGEDKNYRPALARIVGNSIEVQSLAVPSPVYVRYAWKDDGEAVLFNKEGLPASSFSSEN